MDSVEPALQGRSGAPFRALLDAAPDPMVVVDVGGGIVMSNLQAERQFGYRHDELLGRAITDIIPAGFAERIIADAQVSDAAASAGTGVELVALRKDGTEFPIEIMLSPLDVPRGRLITAAIRDITKRRELEAALHSVTERAQVTLDSIGDAVGCTDVAGNITFLNVVAEQLTGWSSSEAEGHDMAEVVKIVNATSRQPIADLAMRAIGGDKVVHLPPNSVLVRRDGSELAIEDSTAPIHDEDGKPVGAVIVFRDVSAARAMTRQMAHAAQHDVLTGLPNRTLLNDRIRQAIAAAPRHSNEVAILYMDLDGFKHVNDALGHRIGDLLLKSVADRLVQCVRTSDTVSRQGGDEFVVLLSEEDLGEDAGIVATRILAAVAAPHVIDGHDIHITTSIGVSVYPEDGWDAETLTKTADTAMYQAKEHGRNTYQFFKPAMNARAVERQSIEEGMRLALQRGEFALHYQPKIDLRSGSVTGAEALIRWTHPSRGAVVPDQFIPIAEDSGLILPIGRWVLRAACEQALAWARAGLSLGSVAVNVSAIELEHPDFLDGLFTVLGETGMDPTRLQLELTESVLMKHAESAATILQTVRDHGVQVAVDDFGTGFSSLGYLREFPIDVLKIDRSFVTQITSAGDDTSIVTAVISMARSLDLRVIAEGVETLGQWRFLQGAECDEAQGYYLGRPVPAEEFATILRDGIPAAALELSA